MSAVAERVADGKDTGIEQADDVARVSFLNNLAVLRHQMLRLGKLDLAPALHMVDLHALFEFSGADADKRDAVAVRLVHIGLNFEDERGKIRVERIDDTLIRFARKRRGRHAQEFL